MRTPVLVSLSAVLSLTGCSGALWGNLAVLGITVGIFVATLGLGRVATAASRSGRSPTASTSTSQR